MLEDALLDVFEAVVLLREHVLDGAEVVARGGAIVPWELRDQLEVAPLQLCVRRLRAHRLEAAELAVDALAHFGGQLERLELGAQLVLVVAALAELLLDGLELLAQHDLLLALAELASHLRLDRLAQLRGGARLGDQLDHRAHPVDDVELEQHVDAVLRGGADGGREAIGEQRGLLARRQQVLHRGVDRALAKLASKGVGERVGLFVVGAGLGDRADVRPQVRLVAGDRVDVHALDALDEQEHTASAPVGLLDDPGEDRDRLEVFERRRLDGAVALHGEHDAVADADGRSEGARAATADGEGDVAAREHHTCAEREEGERGAHGVVFRFDRGGCVLSDERNLKTFTAQSIPGSARLPCCE